MWQMRHLGRRRTGLKGPESAGEVKSAWPAQFGGQSQLIPPTANMPCTPHRAPADLAFGGSGHADTINSYPKGTTCFADLGDHAVRLMERRG
jgi:hypothetical protein